MVDENGPLRPEEEAAFDRLLRPLLAEGDDRLPGVGDDGLLPGWQQKVREALDVAPPSGSHDRVVVDPGERAAPKTIDGEARGQRWWFLAAAAVVVAAVGLGLVLWSDRPTDIANRSEVNRAEIRRDDRATTVPATAAPVTATPSTAPSPVAAEEQSGATDGDPADREAVEIRTPLDSTVRVALEPQEVLTLTVEVEAGGWLVIDIACPEPPSWDLPTPLTVALTGDRAAYWTPPDPVTDCGHDLVVGPVEMGETVVASLAPLAAIGPADVELNARLVPAPPAEERDGRRLLPQPAELPEYSLRRTVLAGTTHSYVYDLEVGAVLTFDVGCKSDPIRITLVPAEGGDDVVFDGTFDGCSSGIVASPPLPAAGRYAMLVTATSASDDAFYQLGAPAQ